MGGLVFGPLIELVLWDLPAPPLRPTRPILELSQPAPAKGASIFTQSSREPLSESDRLEGEDGGLLRQRQEHAARCASIRADCKRGWPEGRLVSRPSVLASGLSEKFTQNSG